MNAENTSQQHQLTTAPLLEHQLCRFGAKLTAYAEPGDVLLLHGGLGSGKTTLVQCMAQAFGISEDQYVSSPSYGLMHEYIGSSMSIYHMDLYRLNNADEVEAAGLLDYLTDRDVCLIEWPDRLDEATPDNYLKVTLAATAPTLRTLSLQPYGPAWFRRESQLIKLCAQFQVSLD
ncbi:MAG: tRNA (adenosine(37)-N6)-threonylcarbamoyltransferase complex ATPase subunit type 1 TsaE [Desulfobulbus propionicus]|nr:MAG: tRNA (adenosine(37)-N6)-threonylcarbamoyltransferase complex ATPase subunit type 1 TsaE [Desulfobulbus propionicus]